MALVLCVLAVGDAAAQTTKPTELFSTDGKLLAFGVEGIDVPQPVPRNETSPRTVELLTQAYSADLTDERRAQLMRDLGECKLPAGLAGLRKGMKDTAAMVRADAAR